MSGAGDAGRDRGALARKIWLVYALAAIATSLALLAIYVNAYDDYDVGPRLRALGAVTRRALLIVTFPLGLPASLLADGPLHAGFGCGEETEPCAVFVTWQTLFVALVAQIALLRYVIARRFPTGS